MNTIFAGVNLHFEFSICLFFRKNLIQLIQAEESSLGVKASACRCFLQWVDPNRHPLHYYNEYWCQYQRCLTIAGSWWLVAGRHVGLGWERKDLFPAACARPQLSCPRRLHCLHCCCGDQHFYDGILFCPSMRTLNQPITNNIMLRYLYLVHWGRQRCTSHHSIHIPSSIVLMASYLLFQ